MFGRETPGLWGPWFHLQQRQAHGTSWFKEAHAPGAAAMVQAWMEDSSDSGQNRLSVGRLGGGRGRVWQRSKGPGSKDTVEFQFCCAVLGNGSVLGFPTAKRRMFVRQDDV